MANPWILRLFPPACLGVLSASAFLACHPASRSPQRWEGYISKHCAFTLQKPEGWKVGELYQERPRLWGFTVEDPAGQFLVRTVHGASPAGSGSEDVIRMGVGQMARQMPGFRLAPTARIRQLDLRDAAGRKTGVKTLVLLEGSYSDVQGRRRQFRSLLSCGGGLLLDQRIEAPDGRLAESAPILFQTLASLRVAKGLFPSDEGGRMAEPEAGGAGRALPLAPRRLASGWASLDLPEGWQVADLGSGACIATDPAQRFYFMVAGAEFIAPRYFVQGVRGVLCSEFRSPSDAFAFSAAQTGRANSFQFSFIKQRPDLAGELRTTAGPLRPVAVEDFGYTCIMNGRRYRGFSTGGCSGDAMRASWRLWHFTLLAPAEEFDAALPTLAAILGSYQLNREMAGRKMADNLRNYYAGLRNLSQQIARNSEQMRRENLELHMEKGRLQDYVSYQTTRMIMGEFDYFAGGSGYVRADPSGLYGPGGNQITNEPYGESVTKGMQEINSRRFFEASRTQ